MSTRNFNIDATKSTIEWVGRKVTGAHNGTINIAEGTLSFAEGQLTGGRVTIDTTSIKILDVTDLNTNAQFASHLASDDFFSIEKYPTARLDISSVFNGPTGGYHIIGDLTIKGITRPIEFDAEVANAEGDTLKAAATLIVDRTDYDMRFRSGNFFKDLGDTLIYNDFTLYIQLTAKAA